MELHSKLTVIEAVRIIHKRIEDLGGYNESTVYLNSLLHETHKSIDLTDDEFYAISDQITKQLRAFAESNGLHFRQEVVNQEAFDLARNFYDTYLSNYVFAENSKGKKFWEKRGELRSGEWELIS